MIPHLLHFIWINRKPFSELEYLSLKSAIENTNYKIFFHTDLQPGQAGRLCPYALASERFIILYKEFSCEYMNVSLHPAMYSDILRLQILSEYGGIYSDIDMLWFQNIPYDLNNITLLCPWQNQSYKIVATYILASEKGYSFAPLFKQIDDMFSDYNLKQVRNLEVKSLSKYLTISKLSREFFRQKSDFILKRRYFEKNTWKNVWRFLHNEISEDKIVLNDICGLHICGCQLFGKYKCNTSLILEKHSKLKALCDKWLPKN